MINFLTYSVAVVVGILVYKIIMLLTGDSGSIPISFIVILVGGATVQALSSAKKTKIE